MKPKFAAGENIAMKVPPHQYEATLAFYRDILGLSELVGSNGEIGFDFGGKKLWIDRVTTVSQAEIWLEVETDDLEAAATYLAKQAVVRCDEIEPLPAGFGGFWVSSPAAIIHLVSIDSA